MEIQFIPCDVHPNTPSCTVQINDEGVVRFLCVSCYYRAVQFSVLPDGSCPGEDEEEA